MNFEHMFVDLENSNYWYLKNRNHQLIDTHLVSKSGFNEGKF